jgi:hypothetical protein
VLALKSQLEEAEKRLDLELRAHHATKAASMAREAELEGQLTGHASGLADMQRALEESRGKVRGMQTQEER